MKVICVTLYGLEDLLIREIKKKLDLKSKKVFRGRVLVELDNIIDLNKIRLVKRTYSLIDYFKFNKINQVYSNVDKMDFSDIKESFIVRCNREGNHKFGSGFIERKIGEMIFNKGYKVSMKNYEKMVFVEIVDDMCFIGYLIKDDLCKRPYRLKINNGSINACLAYGLTCLAGCKTNDILVDPFCRDGVICIEASLHGCKNVYGFDESKNNLRNAEINCKLAKANVNFFNVGLKWLDTKFEKGKVDAIVTKLASVSRHFSEEKINGIYSDLFCQAKHILKKDGTMVLCCENDDILRKKISENEFNVTDELTVSIGNLDYSLVVLKP